MAGKASENGDRFKNRVVGLEMIKAKDLKVHPNNWRQHPDDQRGTLLGLLESIGVADAVLGYTDANDDVVLIDGHLRKDLDPEQAWPVVMTDLNDEEASAVLASHDVVTTMAVPDEEELQKLLEEAAAILPADVMSTIDPDFGGWDEEWEGGPQGGPEGKFPIVPQLDEGYDYVLIFATRDTDFAWLQTVLDLPRKKDKTRIGLSRVLTVDEFKERWANK